jgi:hypothetical protein
MVKVKTLSPFDRHHAVELHAMSRVLATLGRALAAHWPKAVGVGQHAGPWPRRPLWSLDLVQPTEIVNFSIFFRIIQIDIKSNLV